MNRAQNTDKNKKGKKKSKLVLFWRQFRKNKGAVIGLIFIVLLVIMAIVSTSIWNYEKEITGMNPLERLQTPNGSHPFGTDYMGRDVMARVFFGARYSLLISLGVVAISFVFGLTIGAIAGYFGGKVENIIMRIIEIFLMIPSFMLVVVFVAAFGIGLKNLILALGLVTVPHFTRIARSSVLSVRSQEYIEAARASGASELHIVFKHVIPNSLSPSLVQASTRFASAIIDAAAFSFLGLGVPPPLPEWGALLNDARSYMRTYPHLILFPGIAIMLTVFAVNLVGDGIRDALDPKLKH